MAKAKPKSKSGYSKTSARAPAKGGEGSRRPSQGKFQSAAATTYSTSPDGDYSVKSIPASWPASVRYLTEYEYHASLPRELRLATAAPVAGAKPKPHPLVAIRRIEDPAHPAFGEHGLFATKKLAPGTHLLDYLGVVHANTAYPADSDYVLTLDRDRCIDAANAGNEARFVNDFRGIRPAGPNVEFRDYVDSKGVPRMGVFVRKAAISKGDELCVTYGKGFWQARGLLQQLADGYGQGADEWSGEGGEEAPEEVDAADFVQE
ncbi:SET domain-containing protein [Allomyces macrogynus ATCC 38327]|uniref:SET domain-containing protein n=1 Tax=Allomyces macrogynus (strain ATCC 38327) TaxID=578462 RepID=A0A0L0RY53_ALLM3|nr:SET domain-containing protein [Allomyces macrogynus ATCC 38327]|eukprot:KNE55332.1 SET domain-containing protein [Allomyces macrogynus ATCC 38327]